MTGILKFLALQLLAFIAEKRNFPFLIFKLKLLPLQQQGQNKDEEAKEFSNSDSNRSLVAAATTMTTATFCHQLH